MATYRYWRVYITANNGDQYTAIQEIELHAVRGGPDITSPSTPATASSMATPAYPPSRLVSNTLQNDNAWATEPGNVFPQWARFDLGTPTEVAEFVVYPPNYNNPGQARAPKDFLIQGSNDDVNWDTVYNALGQINWQTGNFTPDPPPTPRTYVFADAASPGVSSWRYWRVYITANNGSPSATSIQELELRSTVGGPDITMPWMNTAESHSYTPDGYAYYNKANGVIDNDYTDFYYHLWVNGSENGYPLPDWIYVDLGAPRNVAELAMWPQARSDLVNRAPQDFLVQGSSDASNWNTVATFSEITGWSVGTGKTFLLSSPAGATYEVAANDAIIAADNTDTQVVRLLVSTDAVVVADSTAFQASAATSSATDTVAANDVAAGVFTVSSAATDAVGVIDNTSAQRVQLASATQAAAANNTATTKGVFVRSAINSLTAADSASNVLTGIAQASDVLSLLDYAHVVASGTIELDALDSVYGGDASTTIQTASVIALQTLLLQDEANGQSVGDSFAFDEVIGLDSATAQALFALLVNDLLVLGEAAQAQVIIDNAAIDSVQPGSAAVAAFEAVTLYSAEQWMVGDVVTLQSIASIQAFDSFSLGTSATDAAIQQVYAVDGFIPGVFAFESTAGDITAYDNVWVEDSTELRLTHTVAAMEYLAVNDTAENLYSVSIFVVEPVFPQDESRPQTIHALYSVDALSLSSVVVGSAVFGLIAVEGVLLESSANGYLFSIDHESGYRTYVLPSEVRSYVLPSSDRNFVMPSPSRVYVLPVDSRSNVISLDK